MSGWLFLDRQTRVLIRGSSRAVPLSILEFAIVRQMDLRRGRDLRLSREIVDEVYRGVGNPPLGARNIIAATMRRLNTKLAHVCCRIQGHNHGARSYYTLEVGQLPPYERKAR